MNTNNLFFLLLLCTTTYTLAMERVVIEHSQIKHLLTKYSRPKLAYQPLKPDTLDYCEYKKSLNEKELRQTAKNNNESELSRLINLNIDIDARNPESHKTALHYAAKHGNVKMGKLLINKGAIIDIKNKTGCTPLYIAIQQLIIDEGSQNHVEFINLLLSRGASITIKNNNNFRPDNVLTIEDGVRTPFNEIDEKIYTTLIEQCVILDQKYRLKAITDTSPINPSVEEIKKQERIAANRAHALLLCSRLEKEINKEKRLHVNRAHALLLYERLQHPELSRRQGTDTPLYYQETKIYGYSLWCPYSNKMIWVSK